MPTEPPSAPEAIVRRDPTVCGEWDWGMHSHTAMNLAAIADSTREIYELLKPLYVKWCTHLDTFSRRNPTARTAAIRTEGLGWLLANCREAWDATVADHHRCFTEDVRTEHEPTNNDIRDWHCWLYRHFRDWKRDEENS